MPRPDELVSQHMRRWELEERLRERFERDEVQADTCRNVITISRQRGSGGAIIGMILAKELDWRYFDRELVNHIAEHLGTEPQHLEEHDERPPHFVRGLLLQLLEGQRPTEGQYLRSLVRVLRRIRTEGSAVIMGRGAHLVLPDSLRVRVVAPEDIRVERVAELEDMALAEARRDIVVSDRERAQFVRAHFGVDPEDPEHFDLVVNTHTMSLEHAADLILRALHNREEALRARGAC